MPIDQLFEKLKQFAPIIRWLLILLFVVLLVLLAWRVAKASYLYLPSLKTTAAVVEDTHISNDSTALEHNRLSKSLSDLHLFGEYKEVVVPVAPPPQTVVRETNLKLTLLGVLALGDPKLSSVVIAQQGGVSKVYSIGDELPGNAKLSDIFSDHVEISRNGVTETLWFENSKPELSSAPIASVPFNSELAAQQLAQMPPEAQEIAEQMAINNENYIPTEQFKAGTNRDDVKSYYDQLAQVPPTELFNKVEADFNKDPNAAVEQLGLRPQRNRGYLVTSKIPKDVVESYNLRYGDRILEVNGQALGNPIADRAIFKNIRDNGQASVKIQRGRQITTLTVPIN